MRFKKPGALSIIALFTNPLLAIAIFTLGICWFVQTICSLHQSWARHNKSDHVFKNKTLFDYCIVSLSIVVTPFRHQGLSVKCFLFFAFLWGTNRLSRCRCREAKKLSRAQLWSEPAYLPLRPPGLTPYLTAGGQTIPPPPLLPVNQCVGERGGGFKLYNGQKALKCGLIFTQPLSWFR